MINFIINFLHFSILLKNLGESAEAVRHFATLVSLYAITLWRNQKKFREVPLSIFLNKKILEALERKKNGSQRSLLTFFRIQER